MLTRPPKPPTFQKPQRSDTQFVIEPDAIFDLETGQRIETFSPLAYLLEYGALDSGGVVAVRGMHGQEYIGGGTKRIEHPIHLIGIGPSSGFQRLKVGRSRGGIEELHLWGIHFDNPDHSYAPIDTEDTSGSVEHDNGFLFFHGITFEQEQGVWKNEFDQKWAVNGKGAARWYFEDVAFPPCLEHGLYLHYPQELWIYDCEFAETGGTAVQCTSRPGREDTLYYGNKYWPPAGSSGPFVLENVWHYDGNGSRPKLFRDAYSFTFVGCLSDIFLTNCGAVGATQGGIVCWSDWGKGIHYTDGSSEFGPVEGERLGKYSHRNVQVHRFTLRAPECKREALAFSGCESVTFGELDLAATGHWLIALETEGGGPLKNGRVEFCRGFDQPERVGIWDETNDRYQQAEFPELVE